MNARLTGKLLVAAAALLTLEGCQTTDSPDGMTPSPSARIVFVPKVRRVIVQAGEGRYPNLFTTASYAVWGKEAAEPAMAPTPPAPEKTTGDADKTEAVMDANLDSVPVPPEVEAARAGGLTIECHLESEFPDRSIAYDAVGLRGMAIILKLPDGRELQPAQKTLGSDLEEVPVGALRRYGRKLTLYFPESQFMVENPALNPKAGGIRLEISGVESHFYFEWPATPDLMAVPAPRLTQQAASAARKQLRTTRAAIARTSHSLD